MQNQVFNQMMPKLVQRLTMYIEHAENETVLHLEEENMHQRLIASSDKFAQIFLALENVDRKINHSKPVDEHDLVETGL